MINVKRVLYGIMAVCAIAFMMMLFVYLYGKSDNVTFDEDAVIVLGAGIKGEKVTRTLSYRLDKAVEYSGRNPKAVIVVTGGQGPQEDIPEGLAMKRYLVSKGVAEEKIIIEDKSTSTYENFLFSKQILDKYFKGPYKAAVITNGFHIYRATMLAKRLGLSVTHCHAEIKWYSVPLNYSRECAAIVKMWLLGR